MPFLTSSLKSLRSGGKNHQIVYKLKIITSEVVMFLRLFFVGLFVRCFQAGVRSRAPASTGTHMGPRQRCGESVCLCVGVGWGRGHMATLLPKLGKNKELASAQPSSYSKITSVSSTPPAQTSRQHGPPSRLGVLFSGCVLCLQSSWFVRINLDTFFF